MALYRSKSTQQPDSSLKTLISCKDSRGSRRGTGTARRLVRAVVHTLSLYRADQRAHRAAACQVDAGDRRPLSARSLFVCARRSVLVRSKPLPRFVFSQCIAAICAPHCSGQQAVSAEAMPRLFPAQKRAPRRRLFSLAPPVFAAVIFWGLAYRSQLGDDVHRYPRRRCPAP